MAIDLGLNGTLNHTITTAASPQAAAAITTLKPLILLILGIAVYSLFIFKFYRFLASRDILKLRWHRQYGWHEGLLEKTLKTFLYLLEHVVVVPVLVFFWFAVMAALLLFLSRNTPAQVMMISMAIIAAVRVTAYYDEELSKDLAKMIPFALLGVFIVDMNFSSLPSAWESAKQLPLFFDKFVFYLGFVAALELLMRIAHLIRKAIRPEKEEKAKEEDELSVA